jgi:hypothetical protein
MRSRTKTWLAAPALIAVVTAGCGAEHSGQAAGVTAATRQAARASASTQTPQQRAEQDAAMILAAFRPPPTAIRQSTPPVSQLAQPAERPGSADLATRIAWWRAPGQPLTVYGWLRAHPPAGFSLGGTGTIGNDYRKLLPKRPAGVFEWILTYALPDIPGVLTQREMVIQVTAAGSGQAAIRVDADSVWYPARPATERIPAAAQVVTLTPVAGTNPLPAGDRPITVTDPAKVAAIARAVDALPEYIPGTYQSCPADWGRLLRLTFRASAEGPELAVVSASVTGCELVAVTVGGRALPELGGGIQGSHLVQRIMTIAGIGWPGFAAG